jgi:sugar lactone lactonase YvrE
MFTRLFMTRIVGSCLILITLVSLTACGGGKFKKTTTSTNGTPTSSASSKLGASSHTTRSAVSSLPGSTSRTSATMSSAKSTTASKSSNSRAASSFVSSINSSLTRSSLPASFLMGGAIQGTPLNLSNEVSTLAGAAPGADGAGTLARFRSPVAIASDGTYLYVADKDTYSIRKILIATGEATTLAGTSHSQGNVDAIGTAASFRSPRGIATDGTNLYVSDSNTIRKIIISSKEVTTLSINAGLNTPGGIVISSDQTILFVADTGDHTIRKIIIATGEVTTVAGMKSVTGSANGVGDIARFNSPDGLATDGSNLYIADTNNHTIRKMDIATNDVSTLAGTALSSGYQDGLGATARFKSPQGICVDGVNLYVTDKGNSSIRQIAKATGAVTTFAGPSSPTVTVGITDGIGSAARFGFPQGINISGTSLYVADTLNASIRKIAIGTAEVTTVAGAYYGIDGSGKEAHFRRPYGITTNGIDLYIAEAASNAIRKITLATGTVTTLAGSLGAANASADGAGSQARFAVPAGITSDGYRLYVADTGNKTIREIYIAGGLVTTIAGAAGMSGSIDNIIGTDARFTSPKGITTDGTDLYVTDSISNTIRKINITTNEVTTFAGDASQPAGSVDGIGDAARFNFPQGIVTDGVDLYVADTGNKTIRKINITTRQVTTLAGTAGAIGANDGLGALARFRTPQGISSDGTYLYVADGNSNNSIRKISMTTGEVFTLAGHITPQGDSADGKGAIAGFYDPIAITTDGLHLYVTDLNNGTIRKIR